MTPLKIASVLAVFALLVSACNVVIDAGKTGTSTVPGYMQYSNRTINIMVLTPQGWNTRVGIGGEYVMTSPGDSKPENTRPSIIIGSSPVNSLGITGVAPPVNGNSEAYKKSRMPASTTLEAFKDNRWAFLTEQNIGLKLRKSIKKSRLAGHEAYEISYSYKVKEIPQRLMFRETFTLVNGRVYKIIYYADKETSSQYLDTFQIVKNSYRILK